MSPLLIPRIVQADPDDDHVIAAAITAGAELVVSGDRDLLTIGNYQEVQIVTVRDALQRFT